MSKGLDKFYTLPTICEKCLETVGSIYKWDDWGLVIEPSAGNGNFLTRIPTYKKLGIDIAPEHDDIIKQDFLTYTPPKDIKNILVVGNPPFGRVSSLAVKFFNHASKWASVIAFIIPRTFRRISLQNRLNTNFHLILDEDIPLKPCAFSPPMMAKCCFQIWEKRDTKRPIIQLPMTHKDWDFLGLGSSYPKDADFAMRATGGKCGVITVSEFDKLNAKNWHWFKSNINKDILIQRFNSLDYSVSTDTARHNSIGKAELVGLYSKCFK